MADDYAMQFSFKTPSGTLINLRADTEEDMQNNLDTLGALAASLTATEDLIGAMRNVFNIARPASAASGAPVQQVQSAPTSDTPICNHGQPMIRREKFNDDGSKAWGGWFCASQNKNDECDPQWDPKPGGRGRGRR